MSYYISDEGKVSPACVVKRLADFKGKAGKRYTVRKRREVDMLDFLPTYESDGDRLKKTNSSCVLWGLF